MGRNPDVTARWAWVLGAVGAMALAGGAEAVQKDATGIVALRQATMDAQGAHMQALQLIITDQKQFIKDAAFHAESIKESTEYVPALFPKDSMQPASNALPSVWEKPDAFKAASDKAGQLAGKLADALNSGDQQAAMAAFAALGKEGCGGCHTDFRKKAQ
jgi:cytochrome c556